ncbi:MAG: hypothetical protein JO208_12085 [Alphaproteobacteria bacterium]|nr:hypothetical protein [Alphaproteobacteria bacterium]
MIRAAMLVAIGCTPVAGTVADGVLLSPTEGAKLAGQCSRQSPAPVQGMWSPNKVQIGEMEALLPAFFRKQAHDWRGFLRMPNITDADADYLLTQDVRQYAGFVVGGRKIIYVNAVRGWGISDAPNQWRTKAIQICDGGPITFGVEFDPSTKEFSHSAFNGAI